MDRNLQNELNERTDEVVGLKERLRKTNAILQNAQEQDQFEVCKSCADKFKQESKRLRTELKKTETYCKNQDETVRHTCTCSQDQDSNVLREKRGRARQHEEQLVCQETDRSPEKDSAYLSIASQEYYKGLETTDMTDSEKALQS